MSRKSEIIPMGEIPRYLVSEVGKLMSLARGKKWDSVDRIIGKLSSDNGLALHIATLLLKDGFLDFNRQPNADVRDCAFSLLARCDSCFITGQWGDDVVINSIIACYNDPHLFAAGRAADLIRLWSQKGKLSQEKADTILLGFKKRAMGKKEGRKSWYNHYANKDAIPDLYQHLSMLRTPRK